MILTDSLAFWEEKGGSSAFLWRKARSIHRGQHLRPCARFFFAQMASASICFDDGPVEGSLVHELVFLVAAALVAVTLSSCGKSGLQCAPKCALCEAQQQVACVRRLLWCLPASDRPLAFPFNFVQAWVRPLGQARERQPQILVYAVSAAATAFCVCNSPDQCSRLPAVCSSFDLREAGAWCDTGTCPH